MKNIVITTIAVVLLAGCSKPSPPDISIHLAAGANNGKKANIEAIKQHLAAGTNVNAKDARDGGKTPLMHAVFWGHKEIAEVLVSNGGDSNITDDTVGATSLHYSVLGHDWEVSEDRYRIVEILIANGAKVNALANQGRITRRGGTALDMAITSKQVETADLLRKHGGKTGEELKGGEPAGALATDLTSLSPGRNEVQIKHDGQSRRLIITTPKTFGHQGPYPVLFCFHGAGGKAEGQSKRWSPHADERGLIVISAEAVQPQAKWNFRDKFHAEEHDDVGFVLKVVEALITNKIVDPKAVYATGHSSGGLFCYRLAKETVLFAALSPMSCGMVKGAHDPGEKTKPVSIMQVIGDQDKSFNGSSNPKVTMYSAAKRIDVWRTFNRCRPDPVVVNKGEEVVVYTYANQSGIEVAFCKVKGQGHHIRRDLRDIGDSAALDFLLKHKRK